MEYPTELTPGPVIYTGGREPREFFITKPCSLVNGWYVGTKSADDPRGVLQGDPGEPVGKNLHVAMRPEHIDWDHYRSYRLGFEMHEAPSGGTFSNLLPDAPASAEETMERMRAAAKRAKDVQPVRPGPIPPWLADRLGSDR